ncbi:MAG: polysaccharide biosynthesis C-terminal domain-containing protein [Clostridia bacterium]|nr:polysaccharide biosynthesis C-terminal domain-containing protein [Clostridia bacterium]MBQ9774362.1 polysaccharide biosynthesis C-terminal domain-containing protein [Clostridia bacterium]
MVRDLTKGSPTKLIVSFACTMLLASMMNYIYNFTDSLMVGRFVNAEALGAVSAASPFIMLMNNLSFSMLAGVSIVIGQLFGAKDYAGMRRTMANAVWLTVAIISLSTVVSISLCRTVLVWMDTPKGLMDMATTYTVIILLAKPFSAPSWLLAGLFRALGDTKTPMLIAMVNGFGNVVFNFLFLVVFPMGIAGAALGTLCSAATGSVIYLIMFKRRMKLLHFGREEAHPSMPIMKRLLGLGIPLGLESSITTLGSLMLQTAINGHGIHAVTGVAMTGKIMNFFWILYSVVESALLAFCAQNIGARQLGRARRGIRSALLIEMALGALVLVLALFRLDEYVYMAFVGKDAEILEYAHRYLLTQIVFFPCIAMLYVWRAALKSFGWTIPTVMCGIIELIARVTVSLFFADNLQALFFAGPMAWLGTAIFLAILYPIAVRRQARHLAQTSVPKETERETVKA